MAQKSAQALGNEVFILMGQKEQVGGAFVHNLGNQEVSVESGPGGVLALGIRTNPKDEWRPPHRRLSLLKATLLQVRTSVHGRAPTDKTFFLARRSRGLHLTPMT